MSWCGEVITHGANNARITQLARHELDRQVEALFEQHGVAAFFAVLGWQYPERTLLVEGGGVVPESAESPRHLYCACCELEDPLSGAALEVHVRQWLASGDAHELYIGMNDLKTAFRLRCRSWRPIVHPRKAIQD